MPGDEDEVFSDMLCEECNVRKMNSDRLPELFETPPEMKLYPYHPPIHRQLNLAVSTPGCWTRKKTASSRTTLGSCAIRPKLFWCSSMIGWTATTNWCRILVRGRHVQCLSDQTVEESMVSGSETLQAAATSEAVSGAFGARIFHDFPQRAREDLGICNSRFADRSRGERDRQLCGHDPGQDSARLVDLQKL
jgi:hypothetical protein